LQTHVNVARSIDLTIL